MKKAFFRYFFLSFFLLALGVAVGCGGGGALDPNPIQPTAVPTIDFPPNSDMTRVFFITKNPVLDNGTLEILKKDSSGKIIEGQAVVVVNLNVEGTATKDLPRDSNYDVTSKNSSGVTVGATSFSTSNSETTSLIIDGQNGVATATPTATVTPGGPTLTPTPTVTPGGPTLTPTPTNTVGPGTPTPVPPTATPTNVVVPTATNTIPVPTATNTPLPGPYPHLSLQHSNFLIETQITKRPNDIEIYKKKGFIAAGSSVYVIDTDPDSATYRKIVKDTIIPGGSPSAIGIAIYYNTSFPDGSQDKIYVAGIGKLFILDNTGNYESTVIIKKDGNNYSPNLRDIDIIGDDIFGINATTSEVEVFNLTGNRVNSFGSDKLSIPQSLCVDSDNIYVSDTTNHEIDVFNKLGTWSHKYGNNYPDTYSYGPINIFNSYTLIVGKNIVDNNYFLIVIDNTTKELKYKISCQNSTGFALTDDNKIVQTEIDNINISSFNNDTY
ncbi:MAG: hypothetical protein ACOZAR_05070 [Patescibacteria group bacterium]